MNLWNSKIICEDFVRSISAAYSPSFNISIIKVFLLQHKFDGWWIASCKKWSWRSYLLCHRCDSVSMHNSTLVVKEALLKSWSSTSVKILFFPAGMMFPIFALRLHLSDEKVSRWAFLPYHQLKHFGKPIENLIYVCVWFLC